MKKYVVVVLALCMVLVFLECGQPAVAQDTEESKARALLEYQTERKDPWIGVGAAFLLPSLGHVYAEDWWPRGAKFVGLYLASLILMYNEKTASIGLISFIGSRIWEFADAYWAVRDYNKNLAKKYRVKFSLSFKQNRFSSDEKNAIQIGLSYKF